MVKDYYPIVYVYDKVGLDNRLLACTEPIIYYAWFNVSTIYNYAVLTDWILTV